MVSAFQPRKDTKWIVLMLPPIAIFYAVLFDTGFNLPREDDYDSILRFMNGFEVQTGFVAKLEFFMGLQHNKYKLYYTHGIALMLHAFTHRINFFMMQQMGDLAMLGTFLVLVAHLPSRIETWKERALFTLPISLFLFSFRSHQALNWAMASL